MNTDASETSGSFIQNFLTRFMGMGNDVGNPKLSTHVAPFLHYAFTRSDLPVVLPRYQALIDEFAMYVIARERSEVGATRGLIVSFAGPSYCVSGDLAPALLNRNDPVDKAVIDFFSEDTTFILRAGKNREKRRRLRESLGLMQATMSARPRRSWSVAKPLGRLIAQFDAELAAGGEASSLHVLQEIQARGGMTPTNLAHLQIKRLDRLGLSAQLLEMEDLPNVLHQNPPIPVGEAVLNAVRSAVLEESLSVGDLEAAYERLRTLDLPLPVKVDAHRLGPQALTVLLTAALGRGDDDYLGVLLHKLDEQRQAELIPATLLDAARKRAPSAAEATDEPHPAESSAVEASLRGSINSWMGLFMAVAKEGTDPSAVLTDSIWREWPPPADSDNEVAELLTDLTDQEWDRCWRLTGPFIEADEYTHVAPRSTREFINYALSGNRLAVGDLNAVYALTESYLRSSPSANEYRQLLDELRDTSPQWVSIDNSRIVLDFVDRLILVPCPDESARLNLAIALLEPLSRRSTRLDPATLAFSKQLAKELGVPLQWAPTESTSPSTAEVQINGKGEVILLYSLDNQVLMRVAETLEKLAPGIKVLMSSDKISTTSLKQKAQHATRVVLATRCATHAATGAITARTRAKIAFADGSGSASLLRAAVNVLAD
ncbi:hypothetical protein Skr01_54320 [Sphaerisporangium krabiense]|uniref:Uncharacterized protein n=1 Tax=Sphaerisporangium krabiense TaxID=763782 RepID=A0A7W9DQM0_9ACTN|nr:protein DpdD [Sphaerisporangium krabiense]MBB5627189.1 hypothetical protein [Sphaerisporangium krabiense]GII65347.1 hypothetical protein Skr01_54320 [Sphaerisporangium krabiense]